MEIDPLEAIRALAVRFGQIQAERRDAGMPGAPDPGLESPKGRALWAEVAVEQVGQELWWLYHVRDGSADWESLQSLTVAELREWGDRTKDGGFRALRSAPNLRRGWRCEVSGLASLEDALNRLYPGSVADWWAWEKNGAAATTGFREFVGRQTGMYRAAQGLSQQGAEDMVLACCGWAFCTKWRAWTVDSLGPWGTMHSLRIPCLEPCAVALEFARQAAKLESGPQVTVTLTIPEAEAKYLGRLMKDMSPNFADVRYERYVDLHEGDLGNPGNPRRIELLLARIRPELARIARASSE